MIEDIKKEIKTENSVWNPYFDINLLYDLIKADLVEKVGDNK